MFLTVAAVIEQVFEITFEFGYIHDKCVFFQLLNDCGLLLVQLNSRVEKV